MDFQKKNWQFRDLITEDELNRMEDGIEEGITKAEQAQQTADNAQSDIDTHKEDKNNPHEVTSAQVNQIGLNSFSYADPGNLYPTGISVFATSESGSGDWPTTGQQGQVITFRSASNRVTQFITDNSQGRHRLFVRKYRDVSGEWIGEIELLHTGNTGSIVTEDYEVGTWTPEYITTGNPFANITISNVSSGTYIRIGRLVFIRFNITTSYLEKGNASGELRIAGLPFPNGETSVNRHMGISFATVAGFEISPIENYYQWKLAAAPNSTEIVIFQNNPNSAPATAGPEILRDHTTSTFNVIRASGVYYTPSS